MGSDKFISYDDSDSRRFVFSAENQFLSVPFECIVKPPSVNPEIAGFREGGLIMHFVPWKTIDLDGAFRITAPESISEEGIQEVSNGTFKFNGKLEKTKLEILLTAPFEWEETLHPTERENPPVKFICRLISRSTG